MTTAHINAIATAVPPHDVHGAFVAFARTLLLDDRARFVFDRMADRAGIAHRWSDFAPGVPGAARVDADGFYVRGAFPGTGARMALYATRAADLAERAARQLDLTGITHLVVASCTGFTAPGLDQLLAERLCLMPSIERSLIGFMGCYAAVPALRTARHIVRSEPGARVLVVNTELCTLHLQETPELEKVLSFLLFGDGATAAIVSADPHGIALHDFHSVALSDTQDLITWAIGDQGFDMVLSGRVPARIGTALRAVADRAPTDRATADRATAGMLLDRPPATTPHWAVHAGGRTVLDAVQAGLRLPSTALAPSRAVLHDVGNVSSATLMFVLARMMGQPGPGVGMAFGPGLCAETFRFTVL